MTQPDNTQWLDDILKKANDIVTTNYNEISGWSAIAHREIESEQKQAILSHIQANYTANSEVEKLKFNEKRKGFYMAAGLFTDMTLNGVDELWDECIEQLSNQEDK